MKTIWKTVIIYVIRVIELIVTGAAGGYSVTALA